MNSLRLLEITVDESGARTPCSLYTETGADVRAHQRGHTATGDQAPFQILELQGTESQVVHAVWRLHQTLEPWEPVEVPPPYDEKSLSGLTGLLDDAGDDDGSSNRLRGGSKSERRAGPSIQASAEVEYHQPRTGDIIRRAVGDPPSLSTQLQSQLPERSVPLEVPETNVSMCHVTQPPTQPLMRHQTASEPSSVSMVNGCALDQATASAPKKINSGDCPLSSLSSSRTGGDVGKLRCEKHQVNSLASLPASPYSLMLAAPCAASAAFLASDASGISRRAGVKLRTWLAEDQLGQQAGLPVLEISAPTAESSAIACYLVQVQLWLMQVFDASVASSSAASTGVRALVVPVSLGDWNLKR